MGQPYVSGLVGTNCSVSGPVKTADFNASMTYGYEESKGFYAYTKVSAGQQYLSNSDTNKNFNTKLYPTFTGGVGYNRTGDGFYANIEQGYKEGVDRTTKVLSEVGKITDIQAGIRIPDQSCDIQKFGAYAHSESYSLRGHNLNYDYKSAGAFVSSKAMSNLEITLNAGIQKNRNSAIKPAFGLSAAYTF